MILDNGMNAMYRGVEAEITGQPYPTDPAKINVDFGEMFGAVTHMGVVAHEGEPTDWRVVFPAGQYVPEEDPSNSFHFMITPDLGTFMNVEDLSEGQMEPLAAAMLGLVEEYPQARSGYNIGPDHSKVTSQKWHNLHVHCYQFPAFEHLNATVVESNHRQPLAYRKLHELMWPQIDDVTQWWFDSQMSGVPGVEGVENLKWGLEGVFPKGGTTLILDNNITPLQFAGVLKGVDTVYSDLHRSVFSMFVSNYDTAASSKGREQYELREPAERHSQIQSFHPGVDRMSPFRSSLLNASRVLRPAGEVEIADQIVIPPSYSVTLLQGRGQYENRKLLAVTPHLRSPSGSSEAEGIFPNRQTISGAPVESRFGRAEAVVNRLANRGVVFKV